MAVKESTDIVFIKPLMEESSSSATWLGKWLWALKFESNWSLNWKASINQAAASLSEVGISLIGIRLTWMWTSEGSTPNALSKKVGHRFLYAILTS